MYESLARTYAFRSLKHTPKNGTAVFELNLLTACQTVLKQLHHFTFSISSVGSFQFLHVFASTCHFLSISLFSYNHSDGCEIGVSPWFDLLSPWWLGEAAPSFHVLVESAGYFLWINVFHIICPLFSCS